MAIIKLKGRLRIKGTIKAKVPRKVKRNFDWLVLDDIRKSSGKLGNQGFTASGVNNLAQYIWNIPIPEDNSLKDTISRIKQQPRPAKRLMEFLVREPVTVSETPEGPQLSDGHHRAFLADQLGFKRIPMQGIVSIKTPADKRVEHRQSLINAGKMYQADGIYYLKTPVEGTAPFLHSDGHIDDDGNIYINLPLVKQTFETIQESKSDVNLRAFLKRQQTPEFWKTIGVSKVVYFSVFNTFTESVLNTVEHEKIHKKSKDHINRDHVELKEIRAHLGSLTSKQIDSLSEVSGKDLKAVLLNTELQLDRLVSSAAISKDIWKQLETETSRSITSPVNTTVVAPYAAVRSGQDMSSAVSLPSLEEFKASSTYNIDWNNPVSVVAAIIQEAVKTNSSITSPSMVAYIRKNRDELSENKLILESVNLGIDKEYYSNKYIKHYLDSILG